MYKCKIQNCPTMLKHKTNCKKHWRQIYTHGAPMQTNFDSRPAIAEGDHYKIPLGLNAVNGHTLVDKEYKYLDTHKWNLSGTGYATASIKGRVVRLHRLIKDAPSDKQIDHINNNRLDNRVKNLRLCLNAENGRNRSKQSNNTTGFKGVYRHGGRFRAKIVCLGKQIHLGTHDTALEAARAYDQGAEKYFGKYAKFNLTLKTGV